MADDKSGKPPPLMGATAIRPPDRVGHEKYTYILYDPKNGTVLTRTPKSWALIIIFYCIYYSCLAAFWIACMKIFLTIQINEVEPTWKLDESIIGINPGIGVRPSQTEEEVDTGIFLVDRKFAWDKGTDENEIEKRINKTLEDLKKAKKWADLKAVGGSEGYALRAHDFFHAYGKNDNGDALDNCEVDEDGYRKAQGKFCPFDMSTLKSTNKYLVGQQMIESNCKDFPYGYSNSNLSPCVFLKLNRIMGLKPKPIKDKDAQDDSLKKEDSAKEFLDQLEVKSYPDGVYIKCEGEYPADKEFLEDKLEVMPAAPGIKNTAIIPLKYFPYDKKRAHNENPLVAIQFKNVFNVKEREGRLVHIICRAYYDKVIHSKKDKAGLVKFEIYLNKKK